MKLGELCWACCLLLSSLDTPSATRRAKSKREELAKLRKKYDKTEDDLKALQSVGQTIGEVLIQLDGDRFIVKSSSGPRFVVGYRKKVLLPVRLHRLRVL